MKWGLGREIRTPGGLLLRKRVASCRAAGRLIPLRPVGMVFRRRVEHVAEEGKGRTTPIHARGRVVRLGVRRPPVLTVPEVSVACRNTGHVWGHLWSTTTEEVNT
jgi:hypothetical protein